MKNFLEQRQMEDDTSEKKLEKILDELNHHQMNIEKVYNAYFLIPKFFLVNRFIAYSTIAKTRSS